MSAPLALNASYRDYPPGVALAYEHYYWDSPKEEEEERVPEPVHSSQGILTQEGVDDSKEKAPHNQPDLSPRPSSSGMFTHYTPDSATSPNKQPPSAPQEQKDESVEKKGKTRIAFSQQQLQILQHRFQRQMYLSPQQIRELGSALGLTYKQVKTWFQNQRMKFKRTQKETLWMKNGICQPRNVCLDPSYHQSYTISDAKNFPALASAHDSYVGNQSYSQGPNYSSDHNQIYDCPPNFHPFVSGEEWDGNLFGKGAGTCFGPQAIGYISQQKMNFYHGFSASVEYAAVKMEDSYPFPNVSATATAFPSPPVLQHYQPPLQIPGAQSNFNA
ncbi:homeobox protein NANOG-like [Tiliqua scincoides]|uniref:homeobox protein NANOG-like n=1 Tax=Tiliqua scincoides TaxID=71010 RepID=UPI0034626009